MGLPLLHSGAYVLQFTTSLSPNLDLHNRRLNGIVDGKIPIQFLLCIGQDFEGWRDTFWRSLGAERCFERQDESDTGGYNYKLVHEVHEVHEELKGT